MPKSTRRAHRRRTNKSRKVSRGGGLKEDALKYLESQKTSARELFFRLHKRQPKGNYKPGTKSMGGFTFRSGGHPAQMVYLDVKKNSDNNSNYTTVFTNSDH